MNLYSIILSAGRGTRMKSTKPKVLHPVLDKPMINIILEKLNSLNIEKNFLIVGYKKEEVVKEVTQNFSNVFFCEQQEQLGTGHALLQAKEHMEKLEGLTIITCGDTPLIEADVLEDMLSYHKKENNKLTILSTSLKDPFGYGRIIRDQKQKVIKIVEQKDADQEQQEVDEINSGIYVVDNYLLFKYIKEINNNNSQKEYYLTDLISIFLRNNLKVGAYKTKNYKSILGVNSLMDLAKANEYAKKTINNKHLENGVQIVDPNNTYIGFDVKIGCGTVIYPNNHILGNVKIGQKNILKPGNFIEDATIGDFCEIGPMSHIRGKSTLDNNIRIGNFVEVKNTHILSFTKSAHLTYLGDAIIGQNTNIGCGVITANYDGINKHKTIIGNNTFIGSNVNLIAPVKISDGVFVAAGTTITKDISKDKFVIGRVKQEIKNKR